MCTTCLSDVGQEWAHNHGITLGPVMTVQQLQQAPKPRKEISSSGRHAHRGESGAAGHHSRRESERATTGHHLQHAQQQAGILRGHDEIVWALETHGDRLISASADKTVRVWDVPGRRCERVLENHSRPVLSLAVSNGRLYSGSYDYTIKVCVGVAVGLAVCVCARLHTVDCSLTPTCACAQARKHAPPLPHTQHRCGNWPR